MKITNWDQVNDALRALGEAMGTLGSIENELQLQTNALRAAAEERSAPVGALVEMLRNDIEQFTTEHADELDPGARSRKCTFGVVGFERTPPALKIRNVKKALEKLLDVKRWAELYVRRTPEINREALKAAPAEVLKAVGAKVGQEDNFFARPDFERIRSGS